MVAVPSITDPNALSPPANEATHAKYVSLMCSSVPGGTKVLQQRLHCDVLENEQHLTQTFDLPESTANG